MHASVIVPPAVLRELRAGLEAGVHVPEMSIFPWARSIGPKSLAVLPAIIDLGSGESEVLAVGLENPGSLLIIDDRLARRVGAAIGLRFTGTLGVLLKAKQSGLLPSVGKAISQLRDAGLWLNDDLIASVLTLAGEP